MRAPGLTSHGFRIGLSGEVLVIKPRFSPQFNMEADRAAGGTRLSEKGHDRVLMARTNVAIRRVVCSWTDLRCCEVGAEVARLQPTEGKQPQSQDGMSSHGELRR